MKSDNTAIQQNYADLAEHYEVRWKAFLSRTRDWVLHHLPQTPPQNILDYGCGTGVMLQKLSAQYPDAAVTGIDMSSEMLAIARKNAPQATLINGKFSKSPQQPHDLVLSLNVLHHLPDAAAHLELLRKSCAVNGTIFLCDFAVSNPIMALSEQYWRAFHPAHRKSFTPPAQQDLITKNGLRIDRQAILKPDYFWRLQIYKLSRAAG